MYDVVGPLNYRNALQAIFTSTKKLVSVRSFGHYALFACNINVFLKDDFHSVLRISSAHNKGGPPDINIAQILHL